MKRIRESLPEVIKETAEIGSDIKLLERKKQFCKEYIHDWNATRAYMDVYPNSSEVSAGVQSCNLIGNNRIKAYIKELQKDIEKTVGISREMVALEYMKLAFTSIGQLHNTWIDRKEFDELTENQKSCISEIFTRVVSRKNVGTKEKPVVLAVEEIRIKLYNKKDALDSLVKFFGYAEPEKYSTTSNGKIEHIIKIEEIPTEELSKPAQKLLLEVSQKQLTNGISDN